MSSYLPPGYRFQPTDEELVGFFLRNKVFKIPFPSYNEIVDLDVYLEEPWFLSRYANLGENIEEMYFFVSRELKTKNSKKKPNRRLTKPREGGCWWKASVGDKKILDANGMLLGKKKSLVFHSFDNNDNGNGEKKTTKDGTKTNWIMHEYSLASDTFQEWVLCRIRLNEKKEQEEEIYLTEEDLGLEIDKAMEAASGQGE